MISKLVLIASTLVIACYAQSLPQVDLGYQIYQAISFNVQYLQLLKASLANASYRKALSSTTSATYDTLNHLLAIYVLLLRLLQLAETLRLMMAV